MAEFLRGENYPTIPSKKHSRDNYDVIDKSLLDYHRLDESAAIVLGDLNLSNTIRTNKVKLCVEFVSQNTLACGNFNGEIEIYNDVIGSANKITTLYDHTVKNAPCTSLKFRPGQLTDISNIVLSGYSNGDVKHWHTSSSGCLNTIKESRQVLNCSYSTDGLNFATCGSDLQIFIYDELTLKRMCVLESSGQTDMLTGHTRRVFCVKFHPQDKHLLVSGGWDGSVHFWDTRASCSVSVGILSDTLVCGDSIDVAANTFDVVVGSFKRKSPLQVSSWNNNNSSVYLWADRLNTQLYAAKWINDNTIVCGGANSHALHVIHYPDNYVIGEALNYPEAIYSIAHTTSEHGQTLIAASSGSKVDLYSFR